MAEVIPAINEESFEEVKSKIKLVEPYSKWIHLDVADGTFTPNSIWHDPRDLIDFETPLLIEIHLMIADMDKRWEEWILPSIKRVIFHKEAAHDPHFVLEKIREAGKEVGVAVRPETKWEDLEPFCKKADLVQTLAVPPGIAGQEFRPEILDKIVNLKKKHSECIIEVDGGVNLETGKKCVEAGADILVSASHIFKSGDIKKALYSLKNI